MSDILLFQRTRRDWDTPRNGDFAQYVERLTGGQAVLTLDEPGRVPGFAERAARRAALPAAPLSAIFPQLKQGAPSAGNRSYQKTPEDRPSLRTLPVRPGALRSFVLNDADRTGNAASIEGFANTVRQGLRIARWGFLLLTFVQVGLLMVLGWGWSLGVALSLGLWWVVGALLRLMDNAPDGEGSRQTPWVKVQNELKTLAQQKNREAGAR